MSKRVMLIYPPGKLYQRGEDRAQSNIEDSAASSVHACNDIGYAASILINGGYEVFLRDYQTELASLDDVRSDVERFAPDLILISTTNATIGDDIDFVSWIKLFHSSKVVLKGAIFFDTQQSVLQSVDFSNIDCMIGGEMDTVILDIANCLLLGKGELENISGVIFQDDAGEFIKTDFSCWKCELDDIPFPARNLMKNELYVRPDTDEPMATIQVARGCPASCIYCLTPIISGKKVRFRSVQNVMDELEECYHKYNIRNFFFKADTFTINEKWATELCNSIISSDLYGKIEFTVNSRADTLSSDLLALLKKAGCFMLAIGFESGSDDTLKRIKKGTTVEQNLKAAKMVKQSGIPLFGFFMIGFPWETEKDIEKTLSFIFDINPDFIEIHIAMPYYGTELYQICEEYSTISSQSWNSDYFSPNTIGSATVDMNRIQELKKKYLLRFYMRPSYIAKRMTECVKNPLIFKSYFKYGIRLLKNNIKH